MDSICLVWECRGLEKGFGTHFTEVLLSKNVCSLREMKKNIMGVDKMMRLERCEEKALMIGKVAESPRWAKLCDTVLDLGWKSVQGLKTISYSDEPLPTMPQLKLL